MFKKVQNINLNGINTGLKEIMILSTNTIKAGPNICIYLRPRSFEHSKKKFLLNVR